MSSPPPSESIQSPDMGEAPERCCSDPVKKELCSADEESGQLSSQMGSRTRETVQKVYQMLEKHKATSCESEDELDLSPSSLFDDLPTKLTGRSQQQRASSSRGSNVNQSAGAKRRQQQTSGGATSGSSHSTPSSSTRNSPSRRSTKCDTVTDDDYTIPFETEEETQLASLRCPSERTEIISEREQRRRKRCSDYPGFAFGFGSPFGSDTMMKFSIIRNELHNVINGQLKRVCSLASPSPSLYPYLYIDTNGFLKWFGQNAVPSTCQL